MVNTINNGQIETNTVLLDEFGESLRVRNGGSLQTGDLTGVITQNVLNDIRVDQGGLIQSNQTAIQVEGIGTTIRNAGIIDGGFNGINIANGNTASARITNSGTITSGLNGRAVNIGGVGGVLNNNGLITGTADPRNGTVYGDVTAQNIVINNRRNGVIDVGAGLNGDAVSLELGAQVTGSVTNRGLIQGRGLPDGAPDNATNQAAALRFYWVGASGASTSTFDGNVRNFGTLAVENGAAVIVENQTILDGNIINRGLIESANPANGIGISFENGSQLTGAIINSGTINGGRDGVNFGNGGQVSGTLRNQEGGVITSASRAVNIGGDGNRVINAGLITTTADPRNGTVYADQSANNFVIDNRATGVIDVGEGLNGDAIALQLGANVTGSVINRGTIQGRGNPDGGQNNANNQATAIRLYHGDQAGPVSVFNGDIRNLGAGLLSSENDHAILIENQVQFNGNIVNSGLISSDDEDAIRTEGEFNGNIINRGTIVADRDGLQISQTFNGNINNFGNITSSTGEGIDLRDVSNVGDFTFTGDINNRGTIIGDGGGIRIDNDVVLDGDINNSGTILSTDDNNDGIDILGSITGAINNSGLIQAIDFAIDGNTANDALAVNNGGVIVGDVRLSDFDDVFNGADGITQGEVQGQAGNDVLIGGRLQDTLVGGEGNDTLTGGLGRDTFGFGPSDLGADVITDFQEGVDRIDVDAFNFGVGDVNAIIAGAQQIGGDALLTLAANNTVLLQDVQIGDLNLGDFSL